MASNLPSTQKEDWSLNDTVLPEHTNSWGSAINKLTKAIPIYASNGNYYKVQSFSNNIITLSSVSDKDDLTNETVDSYVDGMQVIFQSTFDTTEDCSVNINNLGAKQIKTVKNKPISTGDITLGNFVQLIYSKNADVFYLVGPSQNGSGLEVCDIGMALYVDETKGLRRYLNGQIVDINANTQGFIDKLLKIKETNPDYFTDEDTWQSEKTMNVDGCVYKFVLNYSGANVVSVRLPKYPDYVEVNAGGTLPVVGNGMALGLTDGTSTKYTYQAVNGNNLWARQPGYLTSKQGKVGDTTENNIEHLTDYKFIGIATDPTKSGIETTLKQTKLKLYYFIQIATGGETEANITNTLENINGFTLLESKYSDKPLYNESWLLSNGQWNAKAVYPTVYEGLQVEYNSEIEAGTTVTLPSGVSYTKRGLSVKLSTEEYTDYDFVLNTTDETFRLPLKTKLASGKVVVGNGMTLGLTNGTYNVGLRSGSVGGGNVLNGSTLIYGKAVGTATNEAQSLNGTTVGVTTDPTKSGIETSDSGLYLYFYVGDIDQNHGIVNMGRIGENLVNKVEVSNTQWATNACMPDYSAGIAQTVNNPYTMSIDGVVYYYGFGQTQEPKLVLNGVTLSLGSRSDSYGGGISGWIPMPKGNTYKFIGQTNKIIFYPLKGAK